MKILVVTPHYYPENFSITSLCEEWARRGHDVFVVTDQPNYGYNRILEGYEKVFDEVINGVRVHRIKTYPRKLSRKSIIINYLTFYARSRHYLGRMKENFDVVYSMSLSPVVAVSGANLYAKKHHVKHVLHCLDLWPESVLVTKAVKEKSLMYKILYHWSRSIYSKADEVVVSSPSFETYFREVLKLRLLPIVSIAQPPLLLPQVGEDKEYKHAHNLVYAGNIGTLQLVENLVRAVSLLKDIDIHLHLIGMGTRTDAVKALIKEGHLEDKVTLYGTKPRGVTASFFPNATAIAVTLSNEGTVGKTIPSKLTSSLYYGRPIFACIEGDGREVLSQAGGSVFSEGESPEQLAEAMKKLCALSNEELDSLGKKNRAYFDAHFSLDTIADEVLKELKRFQ